MSAVPGLTTHALDLALGGPAAGMRVDFLVRDGSVYRLTRTLFTNAQGRTDEPFLEGAAMRVGRYQLIFHVGDYFARLGGTPANSRFFDRVPVRFGIARPGEHYHVPLLVAPCGYTIYRGS